MKKLSILVVLCLSMVMIFSGCGKSNSTGASNDSSVDTEAAIKGAWVLTTICDADGNEQTLDEYCASKGVDAAGLKATYTFEDGGKVTADIGGIGTEGTYAISGTKVNVKFTSGEAAMELDTENNTLTASDANTGMKSVFKK